MKDFFQWNLVRIETPMEETTIGYIVGEGVGQEIMEIALACLHKVETIFNKRFKLVKYEGLAPSGEMNLKESYEQLREFYNEIKNRKGVILRSSMYASLVYKLREEFNQLCKLISLEFFPELSDITPLKEDFAKKINLLLIRDNSQGLYHSEEISVETPNQRFIKICCLYEEEKIRKIAEVAFYLANRRRKKLQLLIKGDVLINLRNLWLEIFGSINNKYPEVKFDWDHPDSGLADMLITPEKFDVVVALDVDGDIISDLIAGLIFGSRAITASANIDPYSGFATFQTVHGSAENIAGRNVANPIGMVMAVAMMLEMYMNMSNAGGLIKKSVREVLRKGYRTPDIFHTTGCVVGTKQMGELIIQEMDYIWNYEKREE